MRPRTLPLVQKDRLAKRVAEPVQNLIAHVHFAIPARLAQNRYAPSSYPQHTATYDQSRSTTRIAPEPRLPQGAHCRSLPHAVRAHAQTERVPLRNSLAPLHIPPAALSTGHDALMYQQQDQKK